MSAQKTLWVRSFTRTEGNDRDAKADVSILNNLSSDFFGWFLQQGANLDINTLNGLASIFWSKCRISIFYWNADPLVEPLN